MTQKQVCARMPKNKAMELCFFWRKAMFTSKKQMVDTLKLQLNTRIDRAINALMVLYSRQTEDEQTSKHTKHANRVGFSALDAEFLSSLALQYKTKGFLSNNQQNALLKLMPKYASQLIESSLALGKIRKENGCYVW